VWLITLSIFSEKRQFYYIPRDQWDRKGTNDVWSNIEYYRINVSIRVHIRTHACEEYTNVEDTCWNPRDRDEGVVGKRLRGLLEPEWAGKKRIETLGFSLETDDACGSLRMRDYGRQLEIRSKQMDCENTLSLSLPLSPLTRARVRARVRALIYIGAALVCMRFLAFVLPSFSLSLSLFLSHLYSHPMLVIRPQGVTSDLDRWCADFPVSIPKHEASSPSFPGSRKAQSEYR